MITTDHVGPILHPVESRTPPTFDADVDYRGAPPSEPYYAAAAHWLNGEIRAARLARASRARRAAARAARPSRPPVRIPVNRPDGRAAAQAALDAETRDWHAELMARSRERLDLAELTPAYTEHLERQAAHDGTRIRRLEAQVWRR